MVTACISALEADGVVLIDFEKEKKNVIVSGRFRVLQVTREKSCLCKFCVLVVG